METEVSERKENVFFPSELPFCIRRNWFIYKNPKKWDLAKLKVFEAGDLVHNWIREVLFKSYITTDMLKDFSYEGALNFKGEGFEISGRYDDCILIEWEREHILIEIKTVRDLRFFKDVKKHHLMQINFYMTLLKLSKGFVIYFDRGTLDYRIFEVRQNDKMFDEIVKRASQLYKHLVEDKIPLPEAKNDKELKWNCSYCMYRLECLKVEK